MKACPPFFWTDRIEQRSIHTERLDDSKKREDKTMKKMMRSGAVLLVLMVVFQAAAYADVIEGRVAGTTPQALDLTV